MKASRSKTSNLGVKEQIKRQVRLWIQTGELAPGQRLPSSSDLAATLKVNRNTAWAAYKELAQEGWLVCGQGKPARVAPRQELSHSQELTRILDNALGQAGQMGVSPKEARRFFLDYLGAAPLGLKASKLVVVECNLPTGAKIADALESELGVSTDLVLIQDIESDPPKLPAIFHEADLVVTGFNHLQDMRNMLSGHGIKVAAVLFDLDLALIKDLADLPPGTKVGFTCYHQRAAESLFNSQHFSQGRSLTRLVVGADDDPALEDMMAQCDPVYATEFVYEKVIKLARPGQNVVRVNLDIDSKSLELIRDLLSNPKGV